MPVRRRLGLLAMLVLVAALLAPATPATAQSATVPTLSVLGQGGAWVTPDTADVSASVTKTSASAQVAREDVARRTNGLLAALGALGVPRADITTTSVSVSRSEHRKAPKVRFSATVSLGVHLVDAQLAGPVLDALVAARADEVDGPSYGFSNPSAGRAEAEQAALADARARADAAAAAVGMRVVGVQSINLDPESISTPLVADAVAASDAKGGSSATPTPAVAGRRQVEAAVAVVFLLG